MKTITRRQWTYEEVRRALEYWFVGHKPISGVRTCGDTGYIVEECDKDQQPSEPREPQPIIPNGFVACGDDSPLMPSDPGLTGESEGRAK